MKYVWFVLLVWAARFLITAVEYPPIDGDLAWQRWLGSTILQTHRIPRALGEETYTAVGAPWTPQEWLFSIFASRARDGIAWDLFACAIGLCAVGAVFLTAYRAKLRGAAPMDLAFAAILTGISMTDSFGVRAQIVGWFMLALMLLFLDFDGPLLWFVVPIVAAWSNMHASAMLAPIFTTITALGRYLEDRSLTPRVRRTFLLVPAVFIAVCCNPLGIGLPLYALSLFGNPITTYISEWRITDIGFYSFSLGSLPILLGGVIIGTYLRDRSRWSDLGMFSVCMALMFFAARNIPIFAIAAAPIVAANVRRAFPDAPIESEPVIPPFVLPVATVVLILFVAFRLHGSPQRMEKNFPEKEIAALSAMPGDHRVFCANFAWCGYLLASPRVRVFMDGRSDPYPLRVWKDFADITFAQPSWASQLDAYRVNVVIDTRGSALDQAIVLSRKWRDVCSDARFRLWMRDV